MNPHDLENLSPEAFMALPEADRLAILTGDSAPPPADAVPAEMLGAGAPGAAAMEPVPAEQGVSVPQPEPAVPPGQAPPAERGDLNVALSQERQRARQAEQRAAELEQFLRDPAALSSLLAQMGGAPQAASPAPEPPALLYEDAEAIEAIVAQAIAPLQQQLQAVTMANEGLMRERQVADMRGRHPDLDQHVGEFDQLRPDLAQLYNPEEKKLLLLGARAADPGWIQQQVEAAATARAEQILAERLGGQPGKPPAPVTLAGVTAAARNDLAPDLAAIDRGQWATLDDATRRRLLGG